MHRATPRLNADELLRELNATRDWPKMALLFSRAIGTIRSHERERVVLNTRIADLERRLAVARQAGAA